MKQIREYRALLLIGVVFVLLLLSNCREEEVFSDAPGDQPTFSVDTLMFDTVFTVRGSVTRFFKVYNPHENAMRIERVRLQEGDNSKFRVNIDGTQGPDVRDLEIAPGDSAYVFVEVTIDPDEPLSSSPFVIEENILFTTNGEDRLILLQAWGQNANYVPFVNGNDNIAVLSCSNATVQWNDPKPYVIFGALIVDSCVLEISAGTRIYVHGGISVVSQDLIFNGGFLFINKEGSLQSLGTVDNPVVWSTDRLEESFQDDAGQWAGIRILAESKDNIFQNTVIRNSIIGIQVDSAAELELDKTMIHTTAGTGLIGVEANITATNCLFANNNQSAFEAVQGGNYRFDHCTFANFGTDRSAINLSNFRCLDLPVCSQVLPGNLFFRCRNSIVTGSLEDEVQLSDINFLSGSATGASFDYRFENCFVRVDEMLDDYPDFFDFCENCEDHNSGQDFFMDVDEINYALDTLSKAIDFGINIGVSDDIEGMPRDGSPDAGCYEYQF
ncbi:MAG TPA: right-handed parallel beta-helix repeat-containing protein [Saprospiraceae bacterium]|nr:right-handed parallel beta-helix repeat-containing protein [Saprospiraceae bacterium]